MKNPSQHTISKVQNLLGILGDIRSRALFGGYSLTVDQAVFGMVVAGKFYLRISNQSATLLMHRPCDQLMFTRRGRDICLNYFLVEESLWDTPLLLCELARAALGCAQQEKVRREMSRRVKDLPNISAQLEIGLWEVGIRDVATLRACGARESWLRLRKANKRLGVRTLYALEGALTGTHEAALPADTRQGLYEWFCNLTLPAPA